MKLWDYYKIINHTHKGKDKQKEFSLIHNGNPVENIRVLTYKSHHKIYKLLRTYKTPQYNLAYLMRNKKGFNTLLFRINYDVVVCNKNGKIIHIEINCNPGHISKYFNDGYEIFFFVVGQIKFMNLQIDEQLLLELQVWTKWDIKKRVI